MIDQLMTIFGFADQACNAIDMIFHGCTIQHEEPGWFVADYVVAAVGFIGVIITIIYTSKSNRLLRDNENEREVNSIKAALKAEITVITNALTKQLDAKLPEIGGNIWINKFDRPRVFESICPQIGLLGEELSRDLVYAYVTFEQFDDFVAVNIQAYGCTSTESQHTMNAPAFAYYKKLLPGLLEDFEKVENKL